MVLIVNRTEFFARIADELILRQQQILLSQQCAQRFQWGHTTQSITWWEDLNFCLIFSTPRLAKRMAALNLATVTSTPAATPPRPKANAFTADWTLGCRSETNSQSSGDDEAAESTSELAMSAFTDAMEKPNPVATGASRVSPLTFQLKSTWE